MNREMCLEGCQRLLAQEFVSNLQHEPVLLIAGAVVIASIIGWLFKDMI